MMKLVKYKFSDLYKMSSGISSKPEQAGHGYPFVSFSTVFNNYILPDTLSDLMDTSEGERENYSIKKGDILLTRTSETIDELGMSSVAIKDYPNSTFSGFVKRLRPTQKNVTYDKYMAFYLRSTFFRKVMTNNAIMTLRASLNEDIFSYLDLHLPDYNTQKSIGDFLFLLNSKIQVNHRIQSQLESMTKTVYDYWFTQFDFPNTKDKPYKTSGGKMEYNEELKREIPKGWYVKRIGEFGEFKNGINYDPSVKGDTNAKIINVRNISSSNLFISQYNLDTISLERNNVNSYLVTEKDILIARSGIPGATRMMLEFAKDTIYCGFIIRFQVKSLSEKNYLLYFLKCMEKNTTSKSGGTIMPNVNQDTLKRMLIVQPHEEVMSRFNNLVNPIFAKINAIIKENQKLAELRDWLLPMLMNGQVKVKNIKERESAVA